MHDSSASLFAAGIGIHTLAHLLGGAYIYIYIRGLARVPHSHSGTRPSLCAQHRPPAVGNELIMTSLIQSSPGTVSAAQVASSQLLAELHVCFPMLLYVHRDHKDYLGRAAS